MSTNANTGQMNSNPRKIDTTWFSLCKSIPTEARIGGSRLALGDVHSFKATHWESRPKGPKVFRKSWGFWKCTSPSALVFGHAVTIAMACQILCWEAPWAGEAGHFWKRVRSRFGTAVFCHLITADICSQCGETCSFAFAKVHRWYRCTTVFDERKNPSLVYWGLLLIAQAAPKERGTSRVLPKASTNAANTESDPAYGKFPFHELCWSGVRVHQDVCSNDKFGAVLISIPPDCRLRTSSCRHC